jgi:hypothetical protein
MTKSLCGKVVHFSKKDAEPHRDSYHPVKFGMSATARTAAS